MSKPQTNTAGSANDASHGLGRLGTDGVVTHSVLLRVRDIDVLHATV